VVDDHAVDGLPIGWFQVRHKAHACVDDFLPVGDFCSERCLVQRCMKIEHPAPPREEA
jgi:hypothetical protein